MRAAICAALVLLAACDAAPADKAAETGINAANYAKVETGMSHAEVAAILGEPGQEISSSDMAGTRTVMYSWESGKMGANMNAMFQNDKLITKAQFGLD